MTRGKAHEILNDLRGTFGMGDDEFEALTKAMELLEIAGIGEEKRRMEIYAYLTSLIGRMTELSEDYKETTGVLDERLEKQVKVLFEAKEIVRDFVDPNDIPF